MAHRITQAPAEVVTKGTGAARFTQDVSEVLGQGAAPALRITQDALEVLAAVPPPQMRVSQDVLEVLVRYSPATPRAWSQIIY